VGLKYWRLGALALSALLFLFTGALGALAAEPQAGDVVFDGVVTVHWADADHGPMAGAVVRIFYHHEGDPIPGIVPLGAPMGADGVTVITGVARPAEGAEPLALDIFGDLDTSTIDEAGCTSFESWSAQLTGVPAGPTIDVTIETSAQGSFVNCPNPTIRPAPVVVGVPPASTGGVQGATGRPQITPPATDGVRGSVAPASGTPLLPALLALLALAVVLAPAGARSIAHHRTASRRQR
jgi:hypothetical protein